MTASTARQPTSPDPFADRRAAPRVSVALPAFLNRGDERRFVQMLDVSAGGAKLALPENGLAIGEEIELDCGTLRRMATVRWAEGLVAGVAFDRELDAREQAALVERSRALQDRMDAAR